MDEKSTDELYQQVSDLHFKERKPLLALAQVEEMLKQDKSGRLFWLKAAILSALNRHAEVAQTLEEAVGYGCTDYPIHQLLTEAYVALGRFDAALAENQRAFDAVSSLSENEAFKAGLVGPQAGPLAVEYSHTRAQVMIRGTQIADLKYMTDTRQALETRVSNVEQQFDKERARTIELLGLFAAILALVFSSVQVASRVDIASGLTLIIGLGLVLSFFLLGLHLVLEPRVATLPAVLVLIGLFVALLALPWYARLTSATTLPQKPASAAATPH